MPEEEEIECREVRLTLSIRETSGADYVSDIFRVGVPKRMSNKDILEIFVGFIGKRRRHK